MDEVLNADKSELAKTVFNDLVVRDWDSLSIDLHKSSLVDEGLDGSSGWVPVGNVRLNLSDHVDSSLVDLDKGGVADLSESEKLKNLLRLRVKLVDTLDSDHESNLWLRVDIDATVSLGVSPGLDQSGV